MHVTSDPLGVLAGTPDCRALASARCVLRGGVVFGIGLQGPRDALAGACGALAGLLPQHGYDESVFADVEREFARALQAAGYGAVRASLERNAPLRPRPVVTAAQVERLIWSAMNLQEAARGQHALEELPDALRGRGCQTAVDGNEEPAVAAYLHALDTHALGYVSDIGAVCGQPFDRLAVYNYIVGHGGKSGHRVQALRALPWLLPILGAPERGRVLREVATIRMAIDCAEPLHEAVARAYDVPREVVRWLGSRTLPANWRLDNVRLRKLLAALSWLAPERRPASPAQFEELVQLCGVLAQIFRFRDDRGDLRMSAWSLLHGPCMRRWLAECRQPGWARDALARDRQGFAAECVDASDFLGTLADAVQDMHGCRDEHALSLVMRWVRGIGLRRLLALSRQWHVQSFSVADPGAAPPEVEAWPLIVPQAMCFGEITVVELGSAKDLHVESARMQHCVATYDRACYSGHSAIVSLRTGSGAILSTAELRLVEDDGLRVALAQHRSARNRSPDAAAARAVEALVLHLNGSAAEPLLRARIRFQQRHRGRERLRQQVRDLRAYQLALRLAGGGLAGPLAP